MTIDFFRDKRISSIESIEMGYDDELLSSFLRMKIRGYNKNGKFMVWPPMDRVPDFTCIILFLNVTNLKLKSACGIPISISGIDVVDVSSNQLEGVVYKVSDFEGEVVSFHCFDIELRQIIKSSSMLTTKTAI